MQPRGELAHLLRQPVVWLRVGDLVGHGLAHRLQPFLRVARELRVARAQLRRRTRQASHLDEDALLEGRHLRGRRRLAGAAHAGALQHLAQRVDHRRAPRQPRALQARRPALRMVLLHRRERRPLAIGDEAIADLHLHGGRARGGGGGRRLAATAAGFLRRVVERPVAVGRCRSADGLAILVGFAAAARDWQRWQHRGSGAIGRIAHHLDQLAHLCVHAFDHSRLLDGQLAQLADLTAERCQILERRLIDSGRLALLALVAEHRDQRWRHARPLGVAFGFELRIARLRSGKALLESCRPCVARIEPLSQSANLLVVYLAREPTDELKLSAEVRGRTWSGRVGRRRLSSRHVMCECCLQPVPAPDRIGSE